VRPLALFAVVAALVALPACRGRAEKEALGVYEAAVEDLVAEDGRVVAELKDLREELVHANEGAGRLGAYVEGTAGPFFRRFTEKAGGLAPTHERLVAVHRHLLDYLAEREKYVTGTLAFEKVRVAPSVVAFERSAKAMQDATVQLQEAGVEQPPQDAAMAFRTYDLFLQARFDPFIRGQLPLDEIRKDVEGKLVPPVAALAARTAGDRDKQGAAGALARWCGALDETVKCLQAALPDLEAFYRTNREADEAWTAADREREAFLAALRSYRESLR
jgi:hypothetical protein